MSNNNNDYFRMRTIEWMGETGIKRIVGKNSFSVSGFFQAAKLITDTGKFISKVYYPVNLDAYEQNNYAGTKFNYSYVSLNDSVLPTKGITFAANASLFSNISRGEFFQKYMGKVQFYIPLGNKFSIALKGGAATVFEPAEAVNSAEFYEHAVIGGVESLRGFKRERFWGKTSFFNNNELRFITNIRTHIVNARAGLLMFYDDGRVWIPGENSDAFHTSWGGGIIFAPFKFPAITVTYGISNEAKLVQVTLNKLL
jgi:outer membrane protein assembly factor BamA